MMPILFQKAWRIILIPKTESILSALGIPASNAINMFYKQIILNRGLPFEVKLPTAKPINVEELTEAELKRI